MEITMELNRRHGRGIQLRFRQGPVDKTYDAEPWTLYEAGIAAADLLDEVNQASGTNYRPEQVIRVTEEALTANAGTDFAAARMLQDIRSQSFELSTPESTDFKMGVVDGEERALLTGRGVVLLCFFLWQDDGNERALESLGRYCEYICAHGQKGGARRTLEKVRGMDKDKGVEWIRKTYARHVQDDAALIQYVMGG